MTAAQREFARGLMNPHSFTKNDQLKMVEAGKSLDQAYDTIADLKQQLKEKEAPPEEPCVNWDSFQLCTGIDCQTLQYVKTQSGIEEEDIVSVFCFMKNGGNYGTTSELMQKWYPSKSWALRTTKNWIIPNAVKFCLLLKPKFLSWENPDMTVPFDTMGFLKPEEQLMIDTVPIHCFESKINLLDGQMFETQQQQDEIEGDDNDVEAPLIDDGYIANVVDDHVDSDAESTSSEEEQQKQDQHVPSPSESTMKFLGNLKGAKRFYTTYNGKYGGNVFKAAVAATLRGFIVFVGPQLYAGAIHDATIQKHCKIHEVFSEKRFPIWGETSVGEDGEVKVDWSGEPVRDIVKSKWDVLGDGIFTCLERKAQKLKPEDAPIDLTQSLCNIPYRKNQIWPENRRPGQNLEEYKKEADEKLTHNQKQAHFRGRQEHVFGASLFNRWTIFRKMRMRTSSAAYTFFCCACIMLNMEILARHGKWGRYDELNEKSRKELAEKFEKAAQQRQRFPMPTGYPHPPETQAEKKLRKEKEKKEAKEAKQKQKQEEKDKKLEKSRQEKADETAKRQREQQQQEFETTFRNYLQVLPYLMVPSMKRTSLQDKLKEENWLAQQVTEELGRNKDLNMDRALKPFLMVAGLSQSDFDSSHAEYLKLKAKEARKANKTGNKK